MDWSHFGCHRHFGRNILRFQRIDMELSLVEITKIEEVGLGDRVCIDTDTELKLGEGMLIGSLSRGMFLVHSETVENPYVETRPFRVNAGPVSAYVLVPGGKTRYLVELKGGDPVIAVDSNGKEREVKVVRSKIETRPFLLVEAKLGEVEFHSFLQNAETIRLVTEDGKAVSVVNLKPGDKVLALVDKEGMGRHFGMAVEETIIEK
ncbi:MAG: 3-dehydroquinate synthase II [Candidatus Altiarchaeota archaeon]|nr:3-dehydroquinate synthase II [Candidatus Altiarchaeota archaeon]MBU4342286.1 3-dehydroquinate synthase II [Candidatus Altiarchaeota archaeon]MBU4406611.1 3-dehydroquinate synthase II [Candidatus Altiarchaeota archaeon]MBU4437463.1 3-dehydroquinate synthase II [Candidatus Altiarchaeota archaeon]